MTSYEPEYAAAPRIAIIGGGITGLAAAHRLHELLPHAELVLFEAGPRLGGVLDTAHLDGFLVERSADNFLAKLPHAIDLCRRLEITDELVSTDETRRRAFVVRNGRLLPIPDGFFLMSPRKLWPMLTSPVLSLPGKLRLLAEPFIPRPAPSGRGQGESDLPLPPGEGRGEGVDESVATFARRRLGRETFERLVQPLVAGIYTADPEKLSMAATMPEFLMHERDHGSLLRAARFPFSPAEGQAECESASGARYGLFAVPKNGMSTLIQALAAHLPPAAIHLNTPVTSTEHHNGRWQLFLPLPPGEGRGEGIRHSANIFDAILVALPAHAAAHLLESIAPELSAELAAIEYAGCAVVSFGFHRDQIAHPLDGFGFVVPQIERRRIIAASFASQKFPGRAPTDAVLIRTFIGGALQPELLELPDADLRQLALDELSDLLHITGEPTLTDIARWPRSMPQYHVGHIARMARIEALAARQPTLALAGNAYHGVGIPQCIASAETAAERIARLFTPSPSGKGPG